MIATISGEITYVHEGSAVINVGGVGILIHLTEDTCLASRPGMKRAFHTHLVVREDHLSLYGFETMEARDLFVHLISVAGVGPKTALATLTTISAETVRRAIAADQPEILSRAPGVGKKMAQKIILHLQGQVQPLEPLEAAAKMDEVDSEVMEALTALGYSIVEAQSALQSLSKDEAQEAETRLRKALQYFN